MQFQYQIFRGPFEIYVHLYIRIYPYPISLFAIISFKKLPANKWNRGPACVVYFYIWHNMQLLMEGL